MHDSYILIFCNTAFIYPSALCQVVEYCPREEYCPRPPASYNIPPSSLTRAYTWYNALSPLLLLIYCYTKVIIAKYWCMYVESNY